MFLVIHPYHLHQQHGFYEAFDEPLPRYVYHQFLPLAYGILFELLLASTLELQVNLLLLKVLSDR